MNETVTVENKAPRLAPRLLSINQAAKVGPYSEYTLRKGVKQGTIPYVKIGVKVLINYDKLLKQIEDC